MTAAHPLNATAAAVEVNIRPEADAVIRNGQVELAFDLTTGLVAGRDLAAGVAVFRQARFDLDPADKGQWKTPPHEFGAEDLGAVTDALGAGRRLRVWFKPRKSYDPERFLDVTLYDGQPFVAIGWGIHNPFGYTVRVRDAQVLAGAELFVDQKPSDARVLRSGAGAERNVVENTWQVDAVNGAMLTYVDTAADPPARRTIVAGGLAYAEFARRVILDEKVTRKDGKNVPDGAQMTLSVWDSQGKRVKAGETWVSQDTFYLDFVTADPFAALEGYGEAMALANAARPNVYDFPTLCGWMTSTSGHGDGTPINHSPGLVEEMDRARRAGLLKYAPLAVRLEPDFYCYSTQGDTQQGWWDDEHFARYESLRAPYETFAKFCKAVEERGGIVLTYFQCSLPSNDFATAHPDWMLNNDISLLHIDHPHHKPLVRYDYTDPGFQAHCRKVWANLRDAGVKGIKFDYPETAWALHGGFEDESYTTTSAYRKLYELCREGLGPDALLHERIIGESQVPCTDATAGVVDLQRVWGDASYFAPEMASRIGLRWFKQGKVFRYYPDGKSFYKAGPQPKTPLDAKDRRTFLTLVGLLSGRVELGTGFRRMTPEMLHDLTRLYPMLPNGQAFRPVDMLLDREHPATYVYEVAPDWKQVILVNNDTQRSREISAPLSGPQVDTGSLGCDAKADYWVFDFWDQKLLGRFAGGDRLTAKLEPGEARVYAVRRVLDRPRVVGANRHVMCGMFELGAEEWDAGTGTLRFSARLVPGEPLKVTLASPGPGLQVAGAEATCAAVTAQTDGSVATITIDGGEQTAAVVTLRFEERR